MFNTHTHKNTMEQFQTQNGYTATIVEEYKGYTIATVTGTRFDRPFEYTAAFQNGEEVHTPGGGTIRDRVDYHIEKLRDINMRNGQFDTNEFVGLYVSESLWTDTRIVGRVVDTFGKTGIVVQPMRATKQTAELEFTPGGFAAHCHNQSQQEWEFKMTDDAPLRLRCGKGFHAAGYRLRETPSHYVDFNF